MTFRTKLGIVAASTSLLLVLAGCAPSTSGTGTGDQLAGTTWSGTDSRNHEWEFDFHEDRTLGFSYKGKSFDDSSDTWTVAGGQLRIIIEFGDGTATMVGPYEDGADSVDLDGSQSGQSGSWTLTITE
ncbi:hypothetical protein M2152_001266 [Microbacteriaceae bacterium SG_E_30_P1]|uniref:Lipoprotein n=1 Tax=Antiquaquibacter oligotrophicus TaxID=2880260 RepID=A0ABT6KMK9_9MICO|nr:hypothetical protein [Antiquaquibacter oligotrophicus]MDH6181084.1 hypothetical protein [Antiquaquibacter oligotrophicus]UDF13218.1 hypothetical protein LH407_13830 [Antiquaquibacter oligotrophicus]